MCCDQKNELPMNWNLITTASLETITLEEKVCVVHTERVHWGEQ